MALICNENPGNNDDKDPDDLYRRHLINQTTYMSIWISRGLTYAEANKKLSQYTTYWEKYPDKACPIGQYT